MKRLKKILKWSGIVLGGLVVILLLVNAWFVWTTDARLEAQLAAIRQAGDPVTLADLARKPIPPDQNAATYLRRAEADITAMEKEFGPYWEWSNKNEDALMPLAIQKSVKAVFDAHPKVMPLLDQAAACPDYDAQLDYSLPPTELERRLIPAVGRRKSIARVHLARARLLAAEGNRDEAVKTSLATFRMARLFDRDALIVGYLTAMAVRLYAVDSANLALQTGAVSPQARNALDAELAIQERMEGYTWILKSERAFGLESSRTFPFRNFWLLNRGIWNQRESAYLDLMQAFIATRDPSDLTIQGIYAKIPTAWGTPSQLAHPEFFAELVFPSLKATHQAVVRMRATLRCLRVLNAIQAHLPAGSTEPPKLSELGLPAEATIDPFNGEPLHVKRLPQGWLVYSVGQNLQDDGGNLDNSITGDVGVGPPIPAGKPTEK
jgi:hypothetical protein